MTEDYFIGSRLLPETKIICRKCGCCENQMESHHVWCKFMDNPHGNTFKEGQPNRYWLCHKELHTEIVKLFNKLLETLKFNGSVQWLWKNSVHQEDKPRIILVVTEFTIKWMEKKENGSGI